MEIIMNIAFLSLAFSESNLTFGYMAPWTSAASARMRLLLLGMAHLRELIHKSAWIGKLQAFSGHAYSQRTRVLLCDTIYQRLRSESPEFGLNTECGE